MKTQSRTLLISSIKISKFQDWKHAWDSAFSCRHHPRKPTQFVNFHLPNFSSAAYMVSLLILINSPYLIYSVFQKTYPFHITILAHDIEKLVAVQLARLDSVDHNHCALFLPRRRSGTFFLCLVFSSFYTIFCLWLHFLKFNFFKTNVP